MASKTTRKPSLSEKEFLDGVRALIQKIYDRGDDPTWEIARFQMLRLGKKRFGSNNNESQLEEIFEDEKGHAQEAYTHQISRQLKQSPKSKRARTSSKKGTPHRSSTRHPKNKRPGDAASDHPIIEDEKSLEHPVHRVVPGSVHMEFLKSQDAFRELREAIYEYLRKEFEAGRSISFRAAKKTIEKAAVTSGAKIEANYLRLIFNQIHDLLKGIDR